MLQSKEFRKWVDEVSELQDSTPLFENPVFTVSELQDRFEVVSKSFIKLNNLPAPKPLPAPKAENEQENVTLEAGADPENAAHTQPSDSASEGAAGGSSEPSPPHEELR